MNDWFLFLSARDAGLAEIALDGTTPDSRNF